MFNISFIVMRYAVVVSVMVCALAIHVFAQDKPLGTYAKPLNKWNGQILLDSITLNSDSLCFWEYHGFNDVDSAKWYRVIVEPAKKLIHTNFNARLDQTQHNWLYDTEDLPEQATRCFHLYASKDIPRIIKLWKDFQKKKSSKLKAQK